jgi:hypothetical protein
MANTFLSGTYAWRAIEKDGGIRSKENGDLASVLIPERLREFALIPQRKVQMPKVVTECAIEKGVLEFFEDGGFKLCKPALLDEIKVIRRMELDPNKQGAMGELWFVGLMTHGLPTCWIHVRPGFTEITLRSPFGEFRHANTG